MPHGRRFVGVIGFVPRFLDDAGGGFGRLLGRGVVGAGAAGGRVQPGAVLPFGAGGAVPGAVQREMDAVVQILLDALVAVERRRQPERQRGAGVRVAGVAPGLGDQAVQALQGQRALLRRVFGDFVVAQVRLQRGLGGLDGFQPVRQHFAFFR